MKPPGGVVCWTRQYRSLTWWTGLKTGRTTNPHRVLNIVFLEQSQALALISEDVSSPECVQQAEVLAAEANRTLAPARKAVASAKQNRSGFFPPSNVPYSLKGKGKGKHKGTSKDSSCPICVRSDHFWRRTVS